jgi:hypothetical protein
LPQGLSRVLLSWSSIPAAGSSMAAIDLITTALTGSAGRVMELQAGILEHPAHHRENRYNDPGHNKGHRAYGFIQFITPITKFFSDINSML